MREYHKQLKDRVKEVFKDKRFNTFCSCRAKDTLTGCKKGQSKAHLLSESAYLKWREVNMTTRIV